MAYEGKLTNAVTGGLGEFLRYPINLLNSGTNAVWSQAGSGGYQSSSKPRKGGSTVNIGDQSYDLRNPSDRRAYEQLMEREQSRQRQRGNGLSDIRGGDGRVPGTQVKRDPDPRPARGSNDSSTGSTGGRNDTRTNAAGVKQTGTNMGPRIATLEELSAFAGAPIANFAGPSFPDQPGANKITAGYPGTNSQTLEQVDLGGGNMYSANRNGRIIGAYDPQQPGSFQGSQLPTTGSNPFEGNPAETPAFNPGAPGITGAKYDNYGSEGGVSAASDTDFGNGPKFTGDVPRLLGNSPNPSKSSDDEPYNPEKGAPLAEKSARRGRSRDIRDRDIGARGGFDPRYDSRGGSSSYEAASPSTGASSTEEMRRRAAFLDGPGGSLEGMKRVKAGMGLVTAGNKNLANVNGEMREISSADMRAILQAGPGKAQALKDKWVAGLTKPDAQTKTPAESQTPTVVQDSAPVKQDEPEFDTKSDLLGNTRVNLPMTSNIFG